MKTTQMTLNRDVDEQTVIWSVTQGNIVQSLKLMALWDMQKYGEY